MLVIVKLWESTWTASKTDSLYILHSNVATFYKPLVSPNSALFYHLKTAEDVKSLFKELLIYATVRGCSKQGCCYCWFRGDKY